MSPYAGDYDRPCEPCRGCSLPGCAQPRPTGFSSTPRSTLVAPGCAQNALDWVSRRLSSRPFATQPVAVLSSSTGSSRVWAAAETRKVMGAWAREPSKRHGPSRRRAPARRGVDADLLHELRGVVDALAEAVELAPPLAA